MSIKNFSQNDFHRQGSGSLSIALNFAIKKIEGAKKFDFHPHPCPPPSRGREFLLHFNIFTLSLGVYKLGRVKVGKNGR